MQPNLNLPPVGRLMYGVWLWQQGWLKSDGGRIFADVRREVAESAAALYGAGAAVYVIDETAMQALEPLFVQQQKQHAVDVERNRAEARASQEEASRKRRTLGQWAKAFTAGLRNHTLR